jgi:hypothetical protein
MTHSKDFFLLLLEHVLIELRALGVEGNLELGPKLADMFHNVPGAVPLPWTPEREERIYSQIRAKAAIYGLSETLDRWEQHVLNRLARETSESDTSHLEEASNDR